MRCIYCTDETGNDSWICENCKHDLDTESDPDDDSALVIIDDEDKKLLGWK